MDSQSIKGLLDRVARVVVSGEDWKLVVKEITQLMRLELIFDNLVIYMLSSDGALEVVCARSIGRGRGRADLSWGEALASQVLELKSSQVQEPDDVSSDDRLQNAFLLGVPLEARGEVLGATVLIRFGGPAFSPEDVERAEFTNRLVTLAIDYQRLQKEHNSIEQRYQQINLKEDFISAMSHELRNPLGVIKGYSTTLLRSDTEWDPKLQQDFLTIIDQETDHLQELIDNLLDSTRLQAGQMPMKFQPVRMDALVTDIASRVMMHHPELKIEVEVKGKYPPVQGDPNRLAQVLENLFANAVKYAPGSAVWVTIKKDRKRLLVKVEDHGPGISAEYLPHMFERFFRNPDQAPGIHGTGLGLFISKKIVEAHRGRISVESEVGRGTKFTISLPLKSVQTVGKFDLTT